MKKSGPWIPSVTVGVRKWLITNPDREGGDVKSNGQIDFFTVPQRVGIQAACLALLLTVVMIAMISGVAGAALAAAGWFLTH